MAPSRLPSRIAVIGRGRLGTALTKAIKECKSFSLVAHVPARATTYKKLRAVQPEVLIIACKDDQISDVAQKALADAGETVQLLIHCAGSAGPTVLPKIKGVSRLMLHPLQTFATSDPLLFAGISFGACCTDPSAMAWAKRFTSELGAQQVLSLREDDLPLYHALAVLSSNAITLLGATIEVVSSRISQSESTMKRALTPLMRQAFRNVMTQKASQVLTGPLVRGDSVTLQKHLRSLKQVSPELRHLYAAFSAFAKAHVVKSSKA